MLANHKLNQNGVRQTTKQPPSFSDKPDSLAVMCEVSVYQYGVVWKTGACAMCYKKVSLPHEPTAPLSIEYTSPPSVVTQEAFDFFIYYTLADFEFEIKALCYDG